MAGMAVFSAALASRDDARERAARASWEGRGKGRDHRRLFHPRAPQIRLQASSRSAAAARTMDASPALATCGSRLSRAAIRSRSCASTPGSSFVRWTLTAGTRTDCARVLPRRAAALRRRPGGHVRGLGCLTPPLSGRPREPAPQANRTQPVASLLRPASRLCHWPRTREYENRPEHGRAHREGDRAGPCQAPAESRTPPSTPHPGTPSDRSRGASSLQQHDVQSIRALSPTAHDVWWPDSGEITRGDAAMMVAGRSPRGVVRCPARTMCKSELTCQRSVDDDGRDDSASSNRSTAGGLPLPSCPLPSTAAACAASSGARQ